MIGIQPAPGREQQPGGGGILQSCSCLSHSGHVHDGVGARGVRGAVVGDHGSPVAFSGVAVATFDVFVGVGLLGAGRGLAGVLVGGGLVAGGLTVAAELIELKFDGGNTVFVFDLISYCFIQISKFSLQYL